MCAGRCGADWWSFDRCGALHASRWVRHNNQSEGETAPAVPTPRRSPWNGCIRQKTRFAQSCSTTPAFLTASEHGKGLQMDNLRKKWKICMCFLPSRVPKRRTVSIRKPHCSFLCGLIFVMWLWAGAASVRAFKKAQHPVKSITVVIQWDAEHREIFFFHHHLRGDRLHFLKPHSRVMWQHTLKTATRAGDKKSLVMENMLLADI